MVVKVGHVLVGRDSQTAVAEVAKTLDARQQSILSLARSATKPIVAEVAKTLDRTPAIYPISGEIGYSLRKSSNLWRDSYGDSDLMVC